MRPSRPLPRVGDRAIIVHLADREPAQVERVQGTTVWVSDAAGHVHVFELHRLTARFVRRGEPYWGTRLAFG